VRETALTIKVDGRHHATAMILGRRKKEFVTGNLYASGVIQSTDDIISLTVKDNVAEVKLTSRQRKKRTAPAVRSKLKVNADDILRCVNTVLKSRVFRETEAVHSAGLFLDGKEAICAADDLGRHNALDKVIGYALLRKIDLSRTVAAITGRQPSEMVQKCRRAGIPSLPPGACPPL
jgi:FdhD protein